MAESVTESPDKEDEDVSFMFKCLLKTIEAKFSNVRNISTSEVELLLTGDRPTSRKVVLMDVREANEYEISHIPTAKHIEPNTDDFTDLKEEITDITDNGQQLKIICYCSLGYRSSAMAVKVYKALQDSGFNVQDIEVLNMRGGLFKWANEMKTMQNRQGEKTIFAHPYSTVWGKFLNDSLRQWKLKNNL